MSRRAMFVAMVVGVGVFGAGHAAGSITDFNNWTLVEDPADPNFTSSINGPSQITLSAIGGPVNSGVDIGYQSVNGITPATSTSGFAFDPSQSFSIAVDFNMSFPTASVGDLGIGFGIGEDGDGMNGAGVALLTRDGLALAFGGAARINDVNQTPGIIFATPNLVRSFFVSYNSATGDVVVGVGNTGAASPSATTTFAGIQNSWSGGLLMASFFLRSDGALGDAWTSGAADAVFTNFRVLSGTPIEVPSPGSAALLALSGVIVTRRKR
ncbi:MAG: hypothetical protein EA380_09470 [Phycisphaeraceae bacterium]|nr:MAG: hypothetical protein EA380_09470 [Phycisphaeraceae bacterium]